MITEALGKVRPEEEVVESLKAEKEEEGSSIIPVQDAIKGKDRGIKEEEEEIVNEQVEEHIEVDNLEGDHGEEVTMEEVKE